MLLAVLSIFLGAALAPFVVRWTGQAAGWILGLLPLGVFAFFVQHLPEVAHGHPIRESMVWLPSFNVPLSFYLDGLSLLFALLVTGIGTLIVVYAGGYLAHHEHLGRFYVQLLSFMGAMLGLVLADNVYLFFIFFELTSLTSYLLIGFYHQDESSRVAARKAQTEGASTVSAELVDVCEALADDGRRVIVAGTDQTYRGEPFEPLPELVAVAEYVEKLQAICAVCGEPATRNQRLVEGEPAHVDDPTIVVGAEESYEARCRDCHEVAGKQ